MEEVPEDTEKGRAGQPRRRCPKCGAGAGPGYAFCASCGEALDTVGPNPTA